MKICPVNQSIKFSYNVAKGSMKTRYDKIRSVSDKVFDGIVEKIHDDKIDINDIATVTENALPENKMIKITKLENGDEFGGGCSYMTKNGKYVGQTIEVPTKDGKIDVEALPVYMHELTHALDTLYNPKYTARTQMMKKRHMYDRRYSQCFDDSLYREEEYKNAMDKSVLLNRRKYEIRQWLAGRSTSEKIAGIQEAKSMMETEIKAYGSEEIYAKKMQAKGLKVPVDEYENNDERFLFKEKLQILNDMGKDIIHRERYKHARELAAKQA